MQDISQDNAFTALQGGGNLNRSMFYAPSGNEMVLESLDNLVQDGLNDNEDTTNLQSPVLKGSKKMNLNRNSDNLLGSDVNQAPAFSNRNKVQEGLVDNNRNSFRLIT